MKLLCLLLLFGHQVFAQVIDRSSESGEFAGISGNPYLFKDWLDGVIRFSSGKVTDKFKLKFNAVQNRLMLQFKGSTFGAESKVNEFVMYTKNKKDSLVFRKGFPAIDKSNDETFYQVLEKGHVTLLRLPFKEIVEETEMVGARRMRHFRDVDYFYILKDGAMHKIDKDLMPIQDILSDRREELKNYISDQQLKMRSTDDLVKVAKRYNELRQ